MQGFKTLMLAGAVVAWAGAAGAETTLRIGLNEDPDILDPTLARTYVGRIVFAGLCDKLFDVTPDLKVVPQLATEYSWSDDNKALTMKLRPGVKFHDGEPLNAAAVKYSIERHIKMPGSQRKGELSSVASVEALDDSTVRLNLSAPFAPLIAQLTDRSGMVISPKAAEAAGDKFGNKPVCTGPYKFAERVAQDRIVIEKFADYWNKDAITIDKIVYLPIPDTSVRLANLRSGQLDFVERLAATDVESVQKDKNLKFDSITSLGYQGITYNVANGDKSKTPLGQDPRIRKAFELSIDREAVNQVVFNGVHLPGNQWVSPENPFYAKNDPMPKRDVEKAKQLLKEAGQPNPSFTLMVPIGPETERVAQVIQAMSKEAGFEVKLQVTEFASALKLSEEGSMQAFLVGWSGRTDPDGNVFSFLSCKGPLNDGHYCNETVDKELALSRSTSDLAERRKHYEAAAAQLNVDQPLTYLYHVKWLFAYTPKLTGFKPVPDGMIRLQGLKLGS